MVVKVTLNNVLLEGFPNLVQCSTVAKQSDRKMTQTDRLYCMANGEIDSARVPSGSFTAEQFRIRKILFWTVEILT